MRLTRKVNAHQLQETREIGEPFVREYQEGDFCELEGTCDRDRLNKLGQLEDIEDELGIDLATLFKALTQTIYFIEEHPEYSEDYIKANGKIYFVNKGNVEQSIVQDCGEFLLQIRWLQGFEGIKEKRFYLDDYGITWALTKEELEK